MKNFKVTPFVCAAPLAIVSFILYRCYCVGSWPLITLMAIVVFTLNIIILVVVDRFLVLWIKQKYLWCIEIAVIVTFILLKAWKSFLIWPLV